MIRTSKCFHTHTVYYWPLDRLSQLSYVSEFGVFFFVEFAKSFSSIRMFEIHFIVFIRKFEFFVSFFFLCIDMHVIFNISLHSNQKTKTETCLLSCYKIFIYSSWCIWEKMWFYFVHELWIFITSSHGMHNISQIFIFLFVLIIIFVIFNIYWV